MRDSSSPSKTAARQPVETAVPNVIQSASELLVELGRGAWLVARGGRWQLHHPAAAAAAPTRTVRLMAVDELRAAGERLDCPADAQPSTALTAQQRQIAELVVSGATNREIAAALFVSTRTVDYHMRNILAKMGLRSRVDLAKVLSRQINATAAGVPAAVR